MIFQIQPHERQIFKTISETAEELGSPAYVVGGYVRDRLLARPSKDMDKSKPVMDSVHISEPKSKPRRERL